MADYNNDIEHIEIEDEDENVEGFNIVDGEARDLITQATELIETLEEKEKELDEALATANAQIAANEAQIATNQANITTNQNASTQINSDLSGLNSKFVSRTFNDTSTDNLFAAVEALSGGGIMWVYLEGNESQALMGNQVDSLACKGYALKVASNWYDFFLIQTKGQKMYTVRYNNGDLYVFEYTGTAL